MSCKLSAKKKKKKKKKFKKKSLEKKLHKVMVYDCILNLVLYNPCCPVLQVRHSNRDNLGIISHTSP